MGEEIQASEEVIGILADESLDDSDKIRRLHAMGFTNPQIIELGFSRSNVYKVLPVHPKGRSNEKQDNTQLPAVIKAGGGQEVITPEGIMRHYLLQDGEQGEWMLKGLMLYRAAQLAVLTDVEIMKGQADAQAKMLKPLLDMMIEARKEQDAAAERARASSLDIASEAAQRTAQSIAGYIDQRLPKGPPPRDMSEMVMKRIDSMWDLMDHMWQQRMFPGYEAGRAPEGWEMESAAPQPEVTQGSQPSAVAPEGWEAEEEKGGEE